MTIKYDVLLFNNLYKIISDNATYTAIIGKNQIGNDYILRNTMEIFNKSIPNININYNSLIWIHGNEASPHFIFWINPHVDINISTINNLIFSLLPKKNINKEIISAMLKDVVLTDKLGQVFVKHVALRKLLYKINLINKL